MSTATTTGLAPDPVVPARDALLDPVALAARLERLTGRPIDTLERVRVKYRIGESLRVLARVRRGDRTDLVSLRTFPEDRLTRELSRARQRAVPTGEVPAVIADPDASAIFWTLPSDRRLRGVERLLDDPTTLVPTLRGRWRSSEVVAWSPERCLTVRCLDGDRQVIGYAKLYESVAAATAVIGRYAAIDRLLRRSTSALAVPTVLGWSPDPAVVVMAPALGVPPRGPEGLRALGAALARVHRLPPPPLGAFGRLRPDRIANTALLIGAARPDCATLASDLARHVARSRPEPGTPVLLHGDVHSANVLIADGEATLIDFDQAGIGPAGCDLGSALARLIRDRVAGRIDVGPADDGAAALLDGYASVRALPDRRSVVWHTAAALLAECGMRAVNRLHEDVLPVLDEVLSAGIDHLDGLDV